MNPSLQTQLEKWLNSMRPREVKEEQAVSVRTDATARPSFIEKVRDKIAEDARAVRR
jgi:hypothetical protein